MGDGRGVAGVAIAAIRAFRSELGLPAAADPLWEGQFSPHGVLALFSSAFAASQPDWPPHTTACGFPFHDHDFGEDADAERLGRFLADGPPPLVFSLGSSAVQAAGDFYERAAEAAGRLGQRAVLVTGGVRSPEGLPDDILAIRSTAVRPLFEAASVVVHAGGIGSTGQALRAGRPQLAVPFAHDQFDNALRVARLGLGRSLRRSRLTTPRLTRELGRLLDDRETVARVTAFGEQVRAEDGAGAAAEVLERVAAAGRA